MAELFNKQYISREYLINLGFSSYQIRKLVKSNDLFPVNKKYYENLQYEGEYNDFYAVPAYVNKGVVCLLSAAVYYGLTTYRPTEINVAIPRNHYKKDYPDFPVIHIYSFSKKRYEIGRVRIIEDENEFWIYDKEKTVCDILFYRNKLGFEVFVEVFQNYMKLTDRDINLLMKYAKDLRVEPLLRKYLEVML